MAISTDELLSAKDAAQALLDRLSLSAYVFEVEPREGDWEVRVECALQDDGWQRCTLAVDKALLVASARDAGARQRLLADWGERLAACRRAEKEKTGLGTR